MAVAGYWFLVVYIISILIGAVIGFLFNKICQSKIKSAILGAAIVGAIIFESMDFIIRLFSSVSSNGEWLYWLTYALVIAALIGATIAVIII